MAGGRFVVLEHDWDGIHYDFMLEVGPALRTWRLPAAPAPGEPQPATGLFPHRLLYLDYEGPVSGGRGTVRRWDAGIYTGDAGQATLVRVRLAGARLCGAVTIRNHPEGDWEWCWNPEEGAG